VWCLKERQKEKKEEYFEQLFYKSICFPKTEMSDNMERDKSERLNARKIEEEEMKRELTGN
jgi:hypothetical protein